MRAEYPGLFAQAFTRELRPADLGIVDAERLRRAADQWQERGEFDRVNLFHALKVEFWLRGLDARASGAPRRPAEHHASLTSVAG
jgi:hypothetical protein